MIWRQVFDDVCLGRAQTRHQLPAEHSSTRHLEHIHHPASICRNTNQYESVSLLRASYPRVKPNEIHAGVAQNHPCVQPIHRSRPTAIPRILPPHSHLRSRILFLDVSTRHRNIYGTSTNVTRQAPKSDRTFTRGRSCFDR